MNAYVVKRVTKDSEVFDPLKLHTSIVAACLSVRAFEGEAHTTAERVCRGVIDWLETKTEVTSADIRRVAATYLRTYHQEAAYMYEHHRLIV
ncbi:hypothetical protein H7Y40_00535 [Pedobacter sp.]|nr:hypothetical protein [Candidatus Saccharibacteria bacterium]